MRIATGKQIKWVGGEMYWVKSDKPVEEHIMLVSSSMYNKIIKLLEESKEE